VKLANWSDAGVAQEKLDLTGPTRIEKRILNVDRERRGLGYALAFLICRLDKEFAKSLEARRGSPGQIAAMSVTAENFCFISSAPGLYRSVPLHTERQFHRIQ
jgi:hypothetical protein